MVVVVVVVLVARGVGGGGGRRAGVDHKRLSKVAHHKNKICIYHYPFKPIVPKK